MPQRKWTPLVLLAIVAWFAAGCDNGEEKVRAVTISRGGEHTAKVVQAGKKQYVVVDDKQVGGKYDDVSGTVLSDTGGSTAFVARRGTEHFVVKDGQPVGPPQEFVAHTALSPAGKSVAYVARTGATTAVFKDDEKIYEAEAGADIGRPVFSPDGSNVAFTVSTNEGAFLFKNGKQIGRIYKPGAERMPTASEPIFTPDGGSVICVLWTQDGSFLIKDNVRLNLKYPSAGPVPIFGPDGELIYIGKDRNKMVLIRGETPISDPYDMIMPPIALSPNGTSIAFAAQSGKKCFIVKDNAVVSKKYDNAYSPVFSPDGRALAFVAREGLRSFVVRNGERASDEYRMIFNMEVSKDGRGIILRVLQGRNTVNYVTIPW